MNVLESILNFLTTLARIIFPRKSKPAADSSCPCPDPLPAPDVPPLPLDAGSGSNDLLHRGDTLALVQGHPRREVSLRLTNATGCCLMLTGAAGCVYKWFVL